jgi:hypothetical protein
MVRVTCFRCDKPSGLRPLGGRSRGSPDARWPLI